MTVSVEQTARGLLDAHQRGVPFRSSDVLDGRGDVAGAYAVQRAFVRMLEARDGATRAGYKIGLTSERMQQMVKIGSPIAGVIFGERIAGSGVALSAARYGRLGLEFEIGLRLAHDLPARATPYTRSDVAAAVGSVSPAMEIVDDRQADYGALDVLSLIADNSWNAGAICGPPATVYPDLATLEGVVFKNGEHVDRGMGSDVLGHPLEALAWLANHLIAQGEFARAGDLVMTGSIVTTKFVAPGERYRFELAGLGSVEAQIVD
jgi:2-keto-4-pentenoate hydratase